MNNTEQWISLDERKPDTGGFWLRTADHQCHCFRSWGEVCRLEPFWSSYTHWCPIKETPPPPPPARAKTLTEEDAQAFLEWGNRTAYASEHTAFMAALVYERAEIARILGCLFPGDKYESRLYAIEKRVKGGAS